MVEVSIIVPCVNLPEITKKCLEFIMENTPKIYELIVVAQSSNEETIRMLAEQHMKNKVKVLFCPEKEGFAGAVNLGIKISKGKYIAIITNDVFVHPNWLEPLLKTLKEHPEYGWVSAQILQPDGMPRYFNIACSLISRTAIEKVGLLDERFNEGKGFEDDDWYWRFLKAGYKPHGVIASKADHPMPESTYAKEGNLEEKHEINRQKFYEKWGFYGTDWSKIPAITEDGKIIQAPQISMIADRFDWLRNNAYGKILDIGSAGGHTFGSRAINLDIDLYKIPNFVRGSAYNLPFKDKSFDTAVLGDVLEHLDDPVSALKEAKRVAKMVIATVPNEQRMKLEEPFHDEEMSDEEVLQKAVERWIRNNQPAKIIDEKEHPHLFHKRKYTKELLEQHLKQAGLRYIIGILEYFVMGKLHSFWVVKAWDKNE